MPGWWANLIDWGSTVFDLTPHVIERIMWTVLIWLGYVVARGILATVAHRRVRDISRKYLLVKSVNYVFGFVVVIATLVIWFGRISGWAAYLGILSAGLAIALQDPVTNFAGWLFITVRRPFVVGDRIQIGQHRGDVIDMRLFQFTVVEIGNWVDADQSTGRIIHIPNGWVFKHSTANYTRGFKFIWNELPITVTFESNWEEAKRILAEIAERHSALKGDQAQQQVRQAARRYLIYFQHLTPIVWTSVADVGVTLTVRYICDPHRRRSSASLIWEDVLRAFKEHSDIDFAYPTTRFYDNVVEGKPDARAAGPDSA